MSSAGIASGATFAHNSIRRPQTYDANGQATNPLVGFTSVWLDAVVFEDRSDTFEQVSAQIKAEHDINSILLEGDWSESAWSKIKAIASGQFPGPPPPGSPLYQSQYLSMERLHVDELLRVRLARGDAAAQKLAESAKNYPSIVKGE